MDRSISVGISTAAKSPSGDHYRGYAVTLQTTTLLPHHLLQAIMKAIEISVNELRGWIYFMQVQSALGSLVCNCATAFLRSFIRNLALNDVITTATIQSRVRNRYRIHIPPLPLSSSFSFSRIIRNEGVSLRCP